MSQRLFALLLLLCLNLAAAAQNPLEVQAPPMERWYGKLDAGVREFRFLIEVNQSAGAQKATLTSFDEGSARFALDEFRQQDGAFSFSIKSTKADYSGSLNQAGDVSTGHWKQGPVNLPLRFEKVAAVPSELPDEVWVGTLNAGFQQLRLQFRIFRTEGEEQLLLFDSLSQSAGGFKGTAKQSPNGVEFEVPAIGIKFAGSKEKDETLLRGKFRQGPGEFELELQRRPEPEVAAAVLRRRPQTPQPPFPYRSEDVRFRNEAVGIELAGTLTLPAGDGPFPAAILVSGSGPQDRDETLFDHKPFLVLADHLTRAGIAVLRYDERGVGESEGDYSTATTKDFTDDVLGAIEFLQGRPEIAPSEIGIIGHSEGGMVAPWAAVRNPKIGWIVLLAGPGVNGEQILYSQGKLLMEAEGAERFAVERQSLIQRTMLELLKEAPANGERTELRQRALDLLTRRLQEQTQQEPEGDLAGDPLATPESEAGQASLRALIEASLAVMDTPWFRFFLVHEPGPVLEQVKCPVLAINGEKDRQVDPRLNLPAIEAALKRGGNSRVTIKELAGLNHLFQSCQTGAVSEYQTIEETLSPQLLETVEQWIKQTLNR
jgi:fermentation-respiration switch protein FrsA (DUF1100 family)